MLRSLQLQASAPVLSLGLLGSPGMSPSQIYRGPVNKQTERKPASQALRHRQTTKETLPQAGGWWRLVPEVILWTPPACIHTYSHHTSYIHTHEGGGGRGREGLPLSHQGPLPETNTTKGKEKVAKRSLLKDTTQDLKACQGMSTRGKKKTKPGFSKPGKPTPVRISL